ncbi:MAG: BadF/BadG/BcrA/BcrD ATPase family protein [Propionicimonas sp.]|uniref:N-acetylglucosamine kinase n=1 Tax=Propionicimonas sp. TaxID=1955623 RepID=UPI002B1FCD19|nr:BadF/BadG/BcrA/BcrD ATPase family protein [Propionicimonas sp.]MEA4943324.1 BadF/BadG/BcrA/BcrD ATPase family protein [Propionicimonas sp.]MEA5054102.1 BadF/BadG/BcrA/BcrD ATPase family protein [Propionicimonas sp.]
MVGTGEPLLVAIDSGQTAIKISVGDGPPLALPGLRANASLLPQLADAVGQAASQVTGPLQVAVGTCGLTRPDNDPERLLRLCEPYGVTRVLLAHDSVTSFLGALGDRRGVTVAAGTGVIILGVGEREVARVDGWGNVIGDTGGGHWIGREALEAVLRAHDGRGPATLLTDVVRHRFPDLDRVPTQLQADPDYVRVVASFARDTDRLADTDPVAGSICDRAGEELAFSAATAVDRIGEADRTNPLICLIGGVSAGARVRAACVAALRRRWPAFVPFPAQGDGLAGARALPSVPAGHPLSHRIAVAAVPAGR